MRVRMSRTGRQHKVGLGHILAVLNSTEPLLEWHDRTYWLGNDDRGIELEIITIPSDRASGDVVVIHAMPTALRE